jgi:hypothetical protein
MCKHENVKFVETIPAYHQRIFEGDEYYKNNEYGMEQLSIDVYCSDCNIHRKITDKNQHKQPKWVTKKIQIMKAKDEWFL